MKTLRCSSCGDSFKDKDLLSFLPLVYFFTYIEPKTHQMKTTIRLLFTFLTAVWAFSCAPKVNSSTPEKEPSLATNFQENFLIGTALNRAQINEQDPIAAKLIQREFNSITAENMLKWVNIHPAPDSFTFEMADKFVALGKKHNMFVIGHTLVWHSQLGEWVEKVEDKEEFLAYYEKHIREIAGRYRGKIDGWDVVNEVLNEDGTLRESVFLKMLGKDYLKEAFRLAAEADPEAELYYNDYNLSNPAKREGALKLIKEIQAENLKIDGVGIQAHWSLLGPSIEQIEESILAYSALGLKVMFTELDITVLPNPWDLQGAEVDQNFEGSPFMNPYPGGLPDSVQIQLADRYEEIFKLFLKHEDKISRVTFWGVNDGQSWLNGWPIKDRTNYPLLFDRKFQHKKAYQRIMELKETKPN